MAFYPWDKIQVPCPGIQSSSGPVFLALFPTLLTSDWGVLLPVSPTVASAFLLSGYSLLFLKQQFKSRHLTKTFLVTKSQVLIPVSEVLMYLLPTAIL